jgi:hypothetical protein
MLSKALAKIVMMSQWVAGVDKIGVVSSPRNVGSTVLLLLLDLSPACSLPLQTPNISAPLLTMLSRSSQKTAQVRRILDTLDCFHRGSAS